MYLFSQLGDISLPCIAVSMPFDTQRVAIYGTMLLGAFYGQTIEICTVMRHFDSPIEPPTVAYLIELESQEHLGKQMNRLRLIHCVQCRPPIFRKTQTSV